MISFLRISRRLLLHYYFYLKPNYSQTLYLFERAHDGGPDLRGYFACRSYGLIAYEEVDTLEKN